MLQRRNGFSLIEILVVTAIVMLLVAMLMPVIQSVRQAAYKTVCISNLNQLGMSMGMYSHDYRGYYPKQEDMGPYPPGKSWSHWAMKLQPYIDKIGKTKGYKTNKIMKCPANLDTYINSWSYNHYAYNSHLGESFSRAGNNYTPRFIPYVIRKNIAVILDGYAYFSIWSTTRVSYRHDIFKADNFGPGRRDGTTNVLFGDLSVHNVKDVPNEMRDW